MCEFKVFLDGEKVMEDVIYARSEGENVMLRDVLGEMAVFEGVEIVEVDVSKTSLVLQRLRTRGPAR
jgi:predicted RNA-binding protein